jgi:DNA-binding GntR family transcriptional regulator
VILLDDGPGSGLLAGLLRDGRPTTSCLVDHMVEDIAQQIILGGLRPGADLNSVELARHYGSSRTPVREALLTLQREGLVAITRSIVNSGYQAIESSFV